MLLYVGHFWQTQVVRTSRHMCQSAHRFFRWCLEAPDGTTFLIIPCVRYFPNPQKTIPMVLMVVMIKSWEFHEVIHVIPNAKWSHTPLSPCYHIISHYIPECSHGFSNKSHSCWSNASNNPTTYSILLTHLIVPMAKAEVSFGGDGFSTTQPLETRSLRVSLEKYGPRDPETSQKVLKISLDI